MRKQCIIAVCLLLLVVSATIKAQVAVSEIPVYLTENARSVVQNTQIIMKCESPVSAVQQNFYIITILNEKGQDAASFNCMCDKFRSLSKFSGELYDASGQLIRKIKKSELKITEYSSGLTSDDYLYYYECNAPSYPYTVKYEWDVKWKNGIIGFPSFVPQTEFYQSVMQASYQLITPPEISCRYREVNTQTTVTQENNAGTLLTKASLNNIKAIESEMFGPSLGELIPRIYFVPQKFSFDGSMGDMSSWKTYGDWQNGLLTGRDLLSSEIKAKLHELTDNLSTPRQKVEAIYNYLGANTRYVSIQLGIGGLQPIAAADVCRSGFGDCKGLSNYTRAMLKEIGIDSRYTVISTTNKRLLPDFASASQMNHVILQVPLPEDTLWLECTNPQLPFGYLHTSIAGRDALLIDPDGGSFCQLPSYPDSLNTRISTARIVITPTGGATVEASEVSRLFQYEHASHITRLDPSKQKDRIREGISLVQANVGTVQIKEQKKAHPEINITYSASSEQYGNKTGNRLFIPVTIFRRGLGKPENKPRIHNLVINYGFMDTDSISIQIPDGFTVEGLPRPATVTGCFGKLETSVRKEGKEIYVVQQLLLRSGTYPAGKYEEFINFCLQVSLQYNGKIILKKE